MGYRGKLELQEKACLMRAESRTLQDIATTLGVSKSSVSVWVRDVPFVPGPRQPSPNRRPHPQHVAKLAEIEECNSHGLASLSVLSDDAFLAAGAALYAGRAPNGTGRSPSRTPTRP